MTRASFLAVGVVLGVGCGAAEPDRSTGSGEDGLDPTAAGTDNPGDDAADDPDDGAASGSADNGGTDPDDDDDDGGPMPIKFDTASPEGEAGCGGGQGTSDLLSYIWIANSPESTISKIDTQTMVEEGRYLTRPDSAGNPSRTSVNLNGNMAVANRAGGVTKVIARAEDCIESNGQPGIQTSTGADDVLAWDDEECRAWHTPLACTSNRPMAWTQGNYSASTCRYEDAKLWTTCLNGNPEIILLDGETGATDGSVVVPEINSMIYGGAVDGDGNFWGSQAGGSNLVFVNIGDMSYEVIPTGTSGYGIAVDSKGRPWLCSGTVTRYDPATGMFDSMSGVSSAGCMTDGQGTLWLASSTLYGVDTETLTTVAQIPLPSYTHGVSIDFDGNVWAAFGQFAYRVDPVTQQIDTFDQLNSAYTYSDMTGHALSSAGTPSG